MSKKIEFEAIDCQDLQYMLQSRSWVCMRYYFDLKYTDMCMRCRFAQLRAKEALIRKERIRG